MAELYELSSIAVRLLGPLLLACAVMIYLRAYFIQGRPPHPARALYVYASHSLAKRRHAGILTYLLAAGSIFFLAALVCLLVTRPPG